MSDPNKPAETENKAEALPEARVLLVGKNQYNLMQVTAFLKEKGVLAKSVYTLKDAIGEVAIFKPSHIFVSVGFGMAKVHSFESTFKGNSGLTIYIFPEEVNKQVDAEIKSSTIKNKMKLNITGGGVFRIIEGWYKQQYALLPPEKRPKKVWAPKKMKKSGKPGEKVVLGSVRVVGGKKKSVDPGKVQHFGGKKKEIEYAKKAEKNNFDGSNVGFACISAPGFDGYAIFLTEYATPLNKSEHRKLTEDMQSELKKYFLEMAREVPPNFEVQIKKVDINSETERFIDLLDVEDNGFKLIEGVTTVPTVDPSAEPDMVSIDIDRIDPDFPTDFDLYIRLDINNKYVKYVNDGDSLSEEKKEKLKAKNITKIHIRKDDQQKFEQYCNHCFVVNTLNQAS